MQTSPETASSAGGGPGDNHGGIAWLASAAAACAAGLLLVTAWPGVFYQTFPSGGYLVFHSAAEFASVVVSFAIFVIGWYGYRQRQDSRYLLLALTFFAVGLLDFSHTLSYPGMPEFLTPNTADRAATLFMVARIVAALGLLPLPFVPDRRLPGWLSPFLIMAVVAGAVVAFIVVYSYHPGILPSAFVHGQGLTAFKTVTEYAIAALELAVLLILRWKRVFNLRSTRFLQTALVFGIFSELAFTLYTSSYDSYNLLGHIYKVFTYYFILRAVFVAALQQPYSELKKTREELESSFASIGAALASSLKLDQVLSLIAVLASDMLGSPHALVALRPDGGGGPPHLRVRASRGIANPPAFIPLKGNLAGAVWDSRAPVLIADVTASPGSGGSVFAAGEGLHSVVSAPILGESDILGEIAVYSHRRGAFGEAEARLLTAFARQAAVAIGNARLFESEKESRGRAESYATQLNILHEIGLQLNREADTGRLLATVLEGAMGLTGAGMGILLLAEGDKTEVISIQYASWYPSRCQLDADLNDLHQGVVRLLERRSGDSLRLEDLAAPDLAPPPGHLKLRGLLAGAIRDTRGGVRGLFMLSEKAEGADFTSQDEDVISLLAAQSAVALVSLENFKREHLVADSLQAALLPSPPVRDDLQMGLLYRSAGPYGRVGGDFYDFVELREGRIAVAVGDVCGKGIEAATYTAMLKYMLRAYLGEGLFPGDCLTRLNAVIGGQLPPERFITVFLAVVDSQAGNLTYASAGHPPPVICRPGRAGSIYVHAAVPLGVLPDQKYFSSQTRLEDTCQVILYSDGLIEARPEGGEPFGQKRLIRAATAMRACDLPAQRVADSLAAVAVEYAGGALRDDIALLVIKFLKKADSSFRSD